MESGEPLGEGVDGPSLLSDLVALVEATEAQLLAVKKKALLELVDASEAAQALPPPGARGKDTAASTPTPPGADAQTYLVASETPLGEVYRSRQVGLGERVGPQAQSGVCVCVCVGWYHCRARETGARWGEPQARFEG